MTPNEDALQQAGQRWQDIRAQERAIGAEVYAMIVTVVNEGTSEVRAAELAGVDRMTVRRALGKRS